MRRRYPGYWTIEGEGRSALPALGDVLRWLWRDEEIRILAIGLLAFISLAGMFLVGFVTGVNCEATRQMMEGLR